MDEPKPSSAVKLPWYQFAYRELLRLIWGELHVDKYGNVVQIERALCAIRAFSILGLIPVTVYGALAGYCGEHCAASSYEIAVVRGISVALLAAIAAFSSGGMLGFLFGLPRWGDAPQVLEQQRSTNGGNGAPNVEPGAEPQETKDAGAGKETAKPAAISAPTVATTTRANRVRPNTGLEKVMDWLTTLIVGLGLVHIRGAIEHAKAISGWVSAAIAGGSTAEQTNFIGGASILLPYAIAGFFLVYLWAQRYMGREMLLADIESNTVEQATQKMMRDNEQTKKDIKNDNRQTLGELASIADELLGSVKGDLRPAASAFVGDTIRSSAEATPGGAAAEGGGDTVEALAGVDAETKAEINRRYAEDDDWFYDPFSEFGIPQANGRSIEATVERAVGKRIFRVSLSVRSSRAETPLVKPVVFLLHHTFPHPIRRVQPVDGVARLTLLSAGTFTAGAVIVDESTRLALNLSTLPGVPRDFTNN